MAFSGPRVIEYMTSSENNKRIAKNTLMLYIRMLLTTGVSLYTSRVVLNVLGVADYGIYSVIGGVVSMFGFINSSMASATQRFFSYEIGRRSRHRLQNVFNMSVNIHLIIAVIVYILAETIGLWIINTQLTIPSERFDAAIWVYRFSVLTMIIGIISVPYNALIIAHERMKVFAGVGIVEVSLKLLIVLMLQWLGYDKLKLYSVLVFMVALIIRLVYGIYCKISFNGISFRMYWDRRLFLKLFSHVGWMLFGTSSNVLSGQGLNVLLNVFFGVTVNAARGIAYSLHGAVNSFVSNFMMAVNPQIIKNFAKKDFEQMYDLVLTSSKLSFYLMFLIGLPVLLLTETILRWWLNIVPEHAVVFSQLVILDMFFSVLFGPISAVSQATGKIKYYQLTVSFGFLLTFILTYVLFKLGFQPYWAFIVSIVMSLMGLIARLVILRIQIAFPVRRYFRDVIQRISLVVILSIPIPVIVLGLANGRVMQFFLVLLASVLSTLIFVWVLGVSKAEQAFVQAKFIQIKNKFFHTS